MSFDDDLRDRFTTSSVSIDDLNAGARAAGAASTRRSRLRRLGGASALAVVLFVGLFAVSNLGDEQASDLRTADPDVSEDAVPVPTTDPNTPATNPTSSTVPGSTVEGTGIATVDVDGVIRINGDIVDAALWLPVLEADAAAPSLGPDDRVLKTSDVDGCTRLQIVDAQGSPADDHPVLALSRCVAGEIAEWSSAGHVVLVAPTQEDAWSITVITADGASAELTSPGAFQPQELDVHTDAAGRTQALVLGTGEELLYVDVDAFLRESVPELAVLGISNDTNLVSAQFVDGIEQHPYQTQIDQLIEGAIVDEGTVIEPVSLVWAVTNVAANDTLNARSGPSTDFDIVFEFGPDATGVVRTGNDATSTDGGEWFEVFAPTSGTGTETGWVNSAFLIESPVSDARPCLFNGPQDHYIGIDWTNPEGAADSDAAVISNIETYRFGGCLRTVIEFSDGWSYEDGGANRVTSLPNDIVITRDTPPTIDFGSSITGAEVADARLAEPGEFAQSTFVSMGVDRQLDGVIYGPSTTMTATFDNTDGTLIVDVVDIRLPADADPSAIDKVGPAVGPLIDEEGLILTKVSNTAEQRSWALTGLARPFEANLGVRVTSTSGSPIDVDWIGGVVDGQRSDNGVITTTWTEAWGQYDFTILLPDGVDPSDILVEFDPSGGAADDPETIVVSLADFAG